MGRVCRFEAAEWLLWFNPFFSLNRLVLEVRVAAGAGGFRFLAGDGCRPASAVAAWRLRPTCLATGDTVKKSRRPLWVPALGDRPMLWKELYIERVGTLGRFGRWLGVLITVAIGGGSLVLAAIILSDLFWPCADGWSVGATNFLSVVAHRCQRDIHGLAAPVGDRPAGRGLDRVGTRAGDLGRPLDEPTRARRDRAGQGFRQPSRLALDGGRDGAGLDAGGLGRGRADP